MSENLYITAAEGHAGKSIVALGVLKALKDAGKNAGIFRPIVQSGGETDSILLRLLREAGIDDDPLDCIGVTYDEVNDEPDAAMARIVQRFSDVSRRHETMIILGSDYTDVSTPTELSYNARIATNLASPVLLVIGGREISSTSTPNSQFLGQSARGVTALRLAAEIAIHELHTSHADIAAILVNRSDPAVFAEAEPLIRTLLPSDDVPIWEIPEDPVLVSPTLRNLMGALGGKQVAGTDEQLDTPVLNYIVSGMSMENILDRLIEDGAIIVPGDRSEVIVAVHLAQVSEGFPKLAGIICNGGFEIAPTVRRLIDGLDAKLPIISVESGTFQTVLKITRTRAELGNAPQARIERGLATFANHVDSGQLLSLIESARSQAVTPLMFEHQLITRAAAAPKHIVLPESDDDRILISAAGILKQHAATLTLLGERETIERRANELGIDLTGANIVSNHDPELVEQFAQEYARLRAHKGMTVEKAREIVTDVSYFGTMMIHMGMADGMVSGAAHSTAHTIKPSFEIIKTRPGVSIVSSVFFMSLPDRVLVYGDCAINPNPTAEQLADIAVSSAQSARLFGIEPRVAMLSYSTGTSGSGDDVERVREATELVRQREPELLIEGPIQYDAAIDAAVGLKKMPGSEVAGKATVFIFPDLNTGNNTYKAVQRSAGALAIGPMLQGLNKPINDLSRGALVKDIINTIALTVVQAQEQN